MFRATLIAVYLGETAIGEVNSFVAVERSELTSTYKRTSMVSCTAAACRVFAPISYLLWRLIAG